MATSPLLRSMRIIMPLIGFTCLVFFTPWPIVKAYLKPAPDNMEEALEQVKDFRLEGIIIYVQKGEEKGKSYAAGWNNRALEIPAKPQDLFKIASVGKLFQALAAVKLAERGKLDLNASISTYLPELSGRLPHAEEIQLKHLIRHHSGIANFTDHPNFPWPDPPIGFEANLQYALEQEALFTPGSDSAYSNTNYLLLGEIMDRQLHYPHQEFIQKEILDPLELKHTYFSQKEVDPERLMSGYFHQYELDIKANYFSSMLSTAADLGRFIRALNNGTIFSSPSEMESYQSLYPSSHTGLIPGYQTIARYHQEKDLVLIQFANISGGYYWTISEIYYQNILKLFP